VWHDRLREAKSIVTTRETIHPSSFYIRAKPRTAAPCPELPQIRLSTLAISIQGVSKNEFASSTPLGERAATTCFTPYHLALTYQYWGRAV
jgi:hypothetical protein